MSEGPEVRRTADRLQEALVGRVIEHVELRRKSGGLSRAVEARVLGARVRRVRTFGKHLVIDFTRGVHLHNHMMMFGKWRTYPRAAYEAGMAVLLPGLRPTLLRLPHWTAKLDQALTRIDRLQPAVKAELVKALVTTIAHDRRMTVPESELLRAICAVLHCPLPPLYAATAT